MYVYTASVVAFESDALMVPGEIEIWLNGERQRVPRGQTLANLLARLDLDPRRVAVEVNQQLVPRTQHDQYVIQPGDRIEVVTLVGGGELSEPEDQPLIIGKLRFRSRLILGSGKYPSFEIMQQCHEASGCEIVTVAVRRERLFDKQGRNILDFIDPQKYTILPNTAGCYTVEDAVRHARLGREVLQGYGNPGADWVKLEVLGDPKTLLPDPIATVQATERLVAEGFQVLVYTTDDPILARRLKQAGAASVMPAGSPIGSGQGILNPNNIRIILEYLKEDDPNYPVIVDAGVGTASDVTIAMELGCDGVLLNTGVAQAKDPVRMAWAMRWAWQAGRQAYLAGRIPKKLYASASSPLEGLIEPAGRRPSA
ncbi:Thiazole synthase [bacterium HR36]|nr:Thiazole synthase [bacterium HR36]